MASNVLAVEHKRLLVWLKSTIFVRHLPSHQYLDRIWRHQLGCQPNVAKVLAQNTHKESSSASDSCKPATCARRGHLESTF